MTSAATAENEVEIEEVVEASEPATLAEKTAEANLVVRNYMLGSMAIGVVPIPVVDLVALVAAQLKMLHSLSKIFDVEFKKDLGKSAISSLAGGALPLASTASVAASVSKFIPFIGQTLSLATLAVLNGASTYALGKVFLQHFASGGTFLTFDPEAVKAFYNESLEEGKAVAEAEAAKD